MRIMIYRIEDCIISDFDNEGIENFAEVSQFLIELETIKLKLLDAWAKNNRGEFA